MPLYIYPGDTKMSAKADLIIVDIYVQQVETMCIPYINIWAIIYIIYIFWGHVVCPVRVFIYHTGPILLSSYPITHIYAYMI